MTLIFSPIEVLWPAYPKQSVFRPEWLLDVGVLPVHASADPDHVVPDPAARHADSRASWATRACRRRWRSLPWLVQFFLAVLVADLAEYGIHRALHEVPFLWRFHAIHHSSKALDWIAGSRAHLVDDLIIRGLHARSR